MSRDLIAKGVRLRISSLRKVSKLSPVKRKEGILEDWLEQIQAEGIHDFTDLAERWIASEWEGQCGNCGVHVWKDPGQAQKYVTDECWNCGGPVIPF